MLLGKRGFRHYVDLLTVLTQKEMKVRYKSSFLGYLWSVLHPLAFAFVFFAIFKVIMRVQMENYTLFLICGLFPWQWFSNSVGTSPGVFLGNAAIIKKVNFPRNVTLLAFILQDMLHFVLAIPVIVLFMFVYQKTPSISWVYGIPILGGIQLLMTYGIGLSLASLNLFFRDLERLTMILMMFLFYCTPVIYPQTMVPQKYWYVLYLNPITPLIVSWRTLFLDGGLVWDFTLVSLLISIVVFLIGFWVYKKLAWRFAEIL